MKDFIEQVKSGSGTLPPAVCSESLITEFGKPLGEEWFSAGDNYEVVFYHDNIEHIALFSIEGKMLEHKYNLDVELLPSSIARLLPVGNELMNVVSITRDTHTEYEIIHRNSTLDRFLFLITDKGEILLEKEL